MLRLLFHRSAPMVYLTNGFALLLLLGLGYRAWWRSDMTLGWGTYLIAGAYLFFNALNLINWYPQYRVKSVKLGIRLHFQKTVVPVAYMCAVAFLFKYLGGSEWVMLGLSLLFLPMYYVSCILLFFHFRDTSKLMPGYFSHNIYLKDENP